MDQNLLCTTTGIRQILLRLKLNIFNILHGIKFTVTGALHHAFRNKRPVCKKLIRSSFKALIEIMNTKEKSCTL